MLALARLVAACLIAAEHSFFFLIISPPPLPTLFPYTTLFRSDVAVGAVVRPRDDLGVDEVPDGAETRDRRAGRDHRATAVRSEEHTSELQSRLHLVCRLLLEKKK